MVKLSSESWDNGLQNRASMRYKKSAILPRREMNKFDWSLQKKREREREPNCFPLSVGDDGVLTIVCSGKYWKSSPPTPPPLPSHKPSNSQQLFYTQEHMGVNQQRILFLFPLPLFLLLCENNTSCCCVSDGEEQPLVDIISFLMTLSCHRTI